MATFPSMAKKMSKTLGNVIDPFKVVEKFGCETSRYFLLREIPLIRTAIFPKPPERTLCRGLGEGIGNLVSRVLAMIENTRMDGAVDCSAIIEPTWLAYQETSIITTCIWRWPTFGTSSVRPTKLVTEARAVGARKNRPGRIVQTALRLAETIRHISLMLWPFMPETAENISCSLGFTHDLGKEHFQSFKHAGA